MGLKDIEIKVKLATIEFIQSAIEKIATQFFNYPEVKGIPNEVEMSYSKRQVLDYIAGLPNHYSRIPPDPVPRTVGQAFLGNMPELYKIERTYYFHPKEGYYNFYFPNFKNIFFLPDWLSQWIQLNWEITTDLRPLIMIQEVLFVLIVAYYFLIEFRMKLFWFLTINPYTRPLVYLIGLTDVLIDGIQGMFPLAFSVDSSSIIVLALIGRLADSLNHLVFTMPFLPSEGVLGKKRVGKGVIKVVVYRYLPYLWEHHPIPNDIREYWYKDQPKILKFMKKYYGKLEIDFEPDRILKEIYDKQHITKLTHENIDNMNHLSTNLVSDLSINSYHNFENFISHSVHICHHTFHKIS